MRMTASTISILPIQAAGVLTEDIFADKLIEITNNVEVPANSYAMLTDNQNGVVVHPHEGYGYVNDEPVNLTDLSAEIPVNGNDEIARLAHGFHNMWRKLSGVLQAGTDTVQNVENSAQTFSTRTGQPVPDDTG